MVSLPIILLTVLLLGAGATALWAHRRATAALARAQAAEARGAGHARCLGLLAEELQAPGLALLGLAGRLGDAGNPLEAQARHVLRLADEVKEVLAASAGPRCLSEEKVELAPLLQEVLASVAAQLGQGRRQWRLAQGFAGLWVHADRRALRGALSQVVARAARLTREGDWIDLHPVITSESLAIVVEDEGVGLGAEDLATGAASAPEHTRGLSFGLAVARSLLEAHGGELRLEAQPGIGARAWLVLPRARLLPG
jgi:signal transduction histidine kinase